MDSWGFDPQGPQHELQDLLPGPIHVGFKKGRWKK